MLYYLKRTLSINPFFIILFVFLFLLLVLKPVYRLQSTTNFDYLPNENYRLSDFQYHKAVVDLYYEKREKWETSNLGSILFQNNSLEANKQYKRRRKRTYLILIWKYWKWLENRHVNSFNNERLGESDPLSYCSVRNCKFSGNDEDLQTADAVVVHIQKGVFPDVEKRNLKQRWVFLSDESPVNSFSMAKTRPKLSQLANVFNWSMTYRSDSDVPVPYGRTIPLKQPILREITEDSLSTLVPNWNIKNWDVLVAILISNCGVSKRMNYLNQLEGHMTVDVYGKCSTNKKKSCPGHFRTDCKLISKYLFYLVFENSQCDEYLTEKSFFHAYSKGAIPVIMGPSVKMCEQLLPPNSFLHVDNYESPQKLADEMMKISQDDKLILSYHRWRNDFAVVNEHGYFGTKSYHLCRICEALNFNGEEEKVYDEKSLGLFLDPEVLCRD